MNGPFGDGDFWVHGTQKSPSPEGTKRRFELKKVIINLCLIIIFIIIYLLHSNLFTWFKIAGVMPNLFIIFVLFIGLYASKYMGIIYGIVFGLALDLFIGTKVGLNAIMYGVIGFVGMLFDKNFSKENRITLIVMVMISTIIFETGEYILGYFFKQTVVDILTYIQILLIETLYNGLLTIVVYPLMQKFGNKIETEYKGNNILTRYF